MTRRSRSRVEQTADDLMTALIDAALHQCEERNPHAVQLLMNRADTVRRIPQQLKNWLPPQEFGE